MEKKSILFVCMGNICRSPMAEGIMHRLVEERELNAFFKIDSAGTIGYHEGELPDPRMRKHAAARGYELTHRSRPIRTSDFDRFDLIIGMDDNNIAVLEREAPSPEAQAKIHRMAEFFTKADIDHVPDPYYGGSAGFDLVIDLLEDGCENLLNSLTKN
ncbi:MAG: low molecular weight phosphotyrosine protein phosphatase [Prevotellaceae bacterium]|jgi:protein-tyrosine phosphatase|nr:low molecular weight phosphotyrosine protein phosphatase [Prevotellaceae bacterium]